MVDPLGQPVKPKNGPSVNVSVKRRMRNALAMSDKADEPLDLQLIPAADATTDEPSELQLEQIPFGRFHIALFVLCGLGWMSDASEGAVLSYLLPQLHDEW